MSYLKTVVEATWEDDGSDKKDMYYLLHFGLKYDLIPDANGNLIPVHYTVAICQHIKNGIIECFLPDQLKVIGIDIKPQ